MSSPAPVIEVEHLTYAYGRAEAVHDLNLKVMPGRCYGLFGRNGAGKTTTMKCLLNLLRPQSGRVRLFGLNPADDEVEIKKRLAYVPDQVAFYSWMTVRDTIEYVASFRERWNDTTEKQLLERFRLDPTKRTTALSKGQRTQLALITAICPEPELLVLDEPTSGLDPIVRREFIETVISAYRGSQPGDRTILASTHLIGEFERLIDDFTIIDRGASVLTAESGEARKRYQRICARFAKAPPELDFAEACNVRRNGRELQVVVDGSGPEVVERLRRYSPEELWREEPTLEEVFVAALKS